ncbi:MAG: hypothetical protein QW117_02355 [Candidatus Pacearchaeota archaeon]
MKHHILTQKERKKGGKRLQEILKKNKELNEKRILAIKEAYKNKLYKLKLSKAQKARFRKKQEREKISRSLKIYHEKHPDAIEQVYKEHPNLREEARKRFIDWIKKNRNALKYIRKGEGNKLNLSYITKNKERVRSTYEVIVANYLKENNIRYEYEAKMLVFPDYEKLKIVFAIPDFFIPDYNAIIEVYGQYPGARAKTIKKNNAYRYYKIPFLGITPSNINRIESIIPKFLNNLKKNPKLTKQARSIMWGTLS